MSTYAEIQECPRRWALRDAEYPELWRGRGYPPRLQVAALAGSVVHLALETITKQFARLGVTSLTDTSATQALRELGGYTQVVAECVERILTRYDDNPRADSLMERARQTLRGQVPTLRSRVQSMLSRLRLPQSTPQECAETVRNSGGRMPRVPLSIGIHPEVAIHAKSIGWKGTVDLLILTEDACEIIDFKSGAVNEAHKFQVGTYAVIWSLDEELNPLGRVTSRLVLAYESQEVDIPPPSSSEIDALGRELVSRRQAAEAALTTRPPTAHPSKETCRYCGVRQLCDEYWASTAQLTSDDGRFGDFELSITGRHGPRSWDAVVVRSPNLPAKTPVLLRAQQHGEFSRGDIVRVLDGGFIRDLEDEHSLAIITLGVMSEAYHKPLGSHHQLLK